MKFLIRILILGLLAFLGYAIFGDLTPQQHDLTIQLPVDGDS